MVNTYISNTVLYYHYKYYVPYKIVCPIYSYTIASTGLFTNT